MSNQDIAMAMRDHHAFMAQQLQNRVQSIETASTTWESARDAVVAYLVDEVLPHAAAEESTVYRVGAKLESLRQLIESMLFEHVVIQGLTEDLRESSQQSRAITLGAQVAKLFEVHAEKENRFIIAVLEPMAEINLEEVLGDMHELLAH